MLKKDIKYTDFDGNERTETFLFNMTEPEVLEWISTDGDYTFDKVLAEAQKKGNARQMMGAVKDIIERSYGEKSLDGRKFVKTKEITEDFVSTNAYAVLYMELLSDEEAMLNFLLGVIPSNMYENLKKSVGVSGDLNMEAVSKFVEDSDKSENSGRPQLS